MTMLEAALDHADRGWRVFPLFPCKDGVCTCGVRCGQAGKHPRIGEWQNRATTDDKQIRSWWSGDWASSGIGIATGEESDLWVLDIDAKRSVDLAGGVLVPEGMHSLKLLEQEHGSIPDTITVLTGGGGHHLYFKYPLGGEHRNRTNVRPGIDVRGEGGFIVAPPTIHANGNRYFFVEDDVMVDPPGWLVNLASQRTSTVVEDHGVGEGGRNEYLHKWGSKFRGMGHDEEELIYLLERKNRQWCEPPLDDEEVRAIARSCMRYQPNAQTFQLDDDPAGASAIPEIPEGADLALNIFDLMSYPPQPPEPLVRGMLSRESSGIIGGEPRVGKSWLLYDLSLAIATGEPFLGRETTQGGVLYVDEETSSYGIYDRFSMLCEGRKIPSLRGVPLDLVVNRGIRIDTPTGDATIRRLLERYKPTLLVLDSLVRVHGGKENDSGEMSRFFARMQHLMLVYQCTILFAHHIRKPSIEQTDPLMMLRGSSDIGAWAMTVFVASRKSKGEIVLHNAKQKHGPELEPEIVKIEVDDIAKVATVTSLGTLDPGDKTDHISKQEQVIGAIHHLGESATLDFIANHLSVSNRTAQEYLGKLERMGRVERETIPSSGKGRPISRYSVREQR